MQFMYKLPLSLRMYLTLPSVIPQMKASPTDSHPFLTRTQAVKSELCSSILLSTIVASAFQE